MFFLRVTRCPIYHQHTENKCEVCQKIEALQDLLSDQSIVIRPCDKGSGVCVINIEDYVHKIENELQDSSTYKQVEKDLTEEITKKVEKTVNKLRKKNYITDDIKKYMLPRNVSQGSVKGNPKMHKESFSTCL
jgi:hypothetical protein